MRTDSTNSKTTVGPASLSSTPNNSSRPYTVEKQQLLVSNEMSAPVAIVPNGQYCSPSEPFAMQNQPSPHGEKTRWEKLKLGLVTLAKFIGPGYLVAVGYFDPGNWATDLSAGSQFGYKLLFIILMANLMAIVLQSLSAKLGVVTRQDLATHCRKQCPKWLNWILYIFCELAIVACDLAEVIGSAIALNLLFGLPLFAGIIVTALDVLLILLGWSAKYIRVYEAIIAMIVVTVGICFATLIGKNPPVWSDTFLGFLPSSKTLSDPGSIYNAVGIIGATVMPHNLYLHSALVRFRAGNGQHEAGQVHEVASDTDSTNTEQRLFNSPISISTSVRMSTIDAILALTIALVVNSSILIVAAANFHSVGRTDIADISDAHNLIAQMLGPAAGVIFAVGLLLSGQSSTITGTLAGQFVMEGFLGSQLCIAPWMRRTVTRMLAIIPALTIVLIAGDKSLNDLLVISQIILSLQLPFAIWPLVYFTSSRRIMTVTYGSAGMKSECLSECDQESGVATPIMSDITRNSNENDMITRLDGVDAQLAVKAAVEAPITESFANSWLTTIVSVIVGLVITVFNVILLVQIATGSSGS
ncbi:hypothetical protein BDV3_001105 [Batrachochytrium dendrobatidis]